MTFRDSKFEFLVSGFSFRGQGGQYPPGLIFEGAHYRVASASPHRRVHACVQFWVSDFGFRVSSSGSGLGF